MGYVKAITLSLLLITAVAENANAQSDYPAKPITLIVNYPAGGGSDAIARAVAQALEKPLNQRIRVENVAGGMATRGVTALVTAPADGYTIGVAHNSALVFTVHNVEGLPWRGPDSYEVIGAIGSIPNLLAAQPGAPYNTVEDLVAYAKKNSGKLRVASVAGGFSQYVWDEFVKAAGIDVRFVPYSGDADGIAAFLGGNVELISLTWSGLKPQVEAAKAKPLALFAQERVKSHPDLPTFKEAGYPIAATSNYVLYTPKGISTEVRSKLASALKQILLDADFLKVMVSRDVDVKFVEGSEAAKELTEMFNTVGKQAKEKK